MSVIDWRAIGVTMLALAVLAFAAAALVSGAALLSLGWTCIGGALWLTR